MNSLLDDKMRVIRTERYACQSVSKIALPDERVAICLRNRTADSVTVHKHKKTKKAFYGGLMVCGSVWTCPVCAAKISEKRREELKKAFSAHKAAGGKIAMLTLTFSHTKKRFAKRYNCKVRPSYSKIHDWPCIP